MANSRSYQPEQKKKKLDLSNCSSNWEGVANANCKLQAENCIQLCGHAHAHAHACNPISRPHKKCQKNKKKKIRSKTTRQAKRLHCGLGRPQNVFHSGSVTWPGLAWLQTRYMLLGDFHWDHSVKLTRPKTKNQWPKPDQTNTHIESGLWALLNISTRLDSTRTSLFIQARLERTNYEMLCAQNESGASYPHHWKPLPAGTSLTNSKVEKTVYK